MGGPTDPSRTSGRPSRLLPDFRRGFPISLGLPGGPPAPTGFLGCSTDCSLTSGGPSQPLPTPTTLPGVLPTAHGFLKGPSNLSWMSGDPLDHSRPHPTPLGLPGALPTCLGLAGPFGPLPISSDPSQTSADPLDPSRTSEGPYRPLPEFQNTLTTLSGLPGVPPDSYQTSGALPTPPDPSQTSWVTSRLLPIPIRLLGALQTSSGLPRGPPDTSRRLLDFRWPSRPHSNFRWALLTLLYLPEGAPDPSQTSRGPSRPIS